MGNHDAGRAMGHAARVALKSRNGRTALQILDDICEPWRGYDAEFESDNPDRPSEVHPEYADYFEPNGPLGILAIEAFGEPGRDYRAEINTLTSKAEETDHDSDWDAVNDWWDFYTDKDGPAGKVHDRFEFC